MEDPSIDLGASHMLSERSTIWARPPRLLAQVCLTLLNALYSAKLRQIAPVLPAKMAKKSSFILTIIQNETQK